MKALALLPGKEMQTEDSTPGERFREIEMDVQKRMSHVRDE